MLTSPSGALPAAGLGKGATGATCADAGAAAPNTEAQTVDACDPPPSLFSALPCKRCQGAVSSCMCPRGASP